MIFIILFLIGIIFGSFLNVVIDRIPRRETILIGRSHCEYCSHPLSWYDLFPLFSFLFLRGKCRYCHKFIGWKYPIIEITSGLVFTLLPFFIPITQTFLFLITLAILLNLVVIFYTDLFSGIIPDIILIILFALTIIRIILFHINLPNSLLSCILAGLFFLLLFAGTKGRGMGFGDVKYAFIMGLLLGFPAIILGLYAAFLTGAAIALILVIARRKSFASAIPFGPFLVLGTVAAFLWGSYLWVIFLHLLNL